MVLNSDKDELNISVRDISLFSFATSADWGLDLLCM